MMPEMSVFLNILFITSDFSNYHGYSSYKQKINILNFLILHHIDHTVLLEYFRNNVAYIYMCTVKEFFKDK